jgi:hypothetical protein
VHGQTLKAGVGVEVEVGLEVGVNVDVCVGEGIGVDVGVAVAVALRSAVGVDVAVGLLVGVTLGVGVPTDCPVSITRLLKLVSQPLLLAIVTLWHAPVQLVAIVTTKPTPTVAETGA